MLHEGKIALAVKNGEDDPESWAITLDEENITDATEALKGYLLQMQETMLRFSGRVVLVTGGSRGIGKAILNLFGEERAKVVILSMKII